MGSVAVTAGQKESGAETVTVAGVSRWAKVIDQSRCIGCHACTIACKAEHGVPLGVTRTYVKQVEVGRWPAVSRQFQVTRCNQCDRPPCVEICPVSAMYRRPDGIVDFDRNVCIGCKACMAACPYDAIYIDPASHSAEKCNFCAHRIDLGLEPACVVVCPERAIIVGDLDDPDSEVSRRLGSHKATVRKPEKGTAPKLFYVDAGTFTLVPGEVRVAPGHAYAQQRESYPQPPGAVDGEGPAMAASGRTVSRALAARPPSRDGTWPAAAAILAYDVPHGPPWDWRVSAYTWTKSIAAGAYLIPALLGLIGVAGSAAWGLSASLTALGFLGLTGLLLIADLKHPQRFWSILIRPQWRSWLARGAYLITLYGILLVADLLGRWLALSPLVAALRLPGLALSGLVAVYTAFLFAQARARDLWQNPALPLHLLVQAVVAGSAALSILNAWLPGESLVGEWLRWLLAAGLTVHLLLALGEAVLAHPTADGAAAARQMTSGAFRWFYRSGLGAAVAALVLAVAGGGAGPAWMAIACGFALLGLLAYEHGYVQAGQSVPLS